MHQPSVFKFIARQLTLQQPVVLLYVVQSKGSSPGREGFCMAVSINEMAGSIGGGIMEYKFVEMAKACLTQPTFEIKKQVHNKVSNHRSGMICSGEQTNVLYTVQAGDAAAVEAIVALLENNSEATLRLSKSGIECLEGVTREALPATN